MRKTSDVTDTEFPFAEDSTPFILLYNGAPALRDEDQGRGFSHASTYDKKYALLEQAIILESEGSYGQEVGKASLLAVWPGARRSDVFFIDDLAAAKEGLG